jgi:hypothetical protein
MDGGGDQCADLTASVDLTVFERCDRRHKLLFESPIIFWTPRGSLNHKRAHGHTGCIYFRASVSYFTHLPPIPPSLATSKQEPRGEDIGTKTRTK